MRDGAGVSDAAPGSGLTWKGTEAEHERYVRSVAKAPGSNAHWGNRYGVEARSHLTFALGLIDRLRADQERLQRSLDEACQTAARHDVRAVEAEREAERLREAGNALAKKAEALMTYTAQLAKNVGWVAATRPYMQPYLEGAKEVGNEYREALAAWRSLVAGTDSGSDQ